MFTTIKKKIKTLCNLTINRECGYIYMLHRVGYRDDNKLFANENMKVSPEFLEEFILEQQKMHQFISLDDLCLLKEGKLKLKKKFVVMTLDDGYLDNFELAYPLFKKYNIPFVIFVATGLLDGKALLWWYQLEELILKKQVIITGDGVAYTCETKEQKEKVFLELRTKILELNPENFIAELGNLIPGILETGEYHNLMMNVDQINLMSKDALCTIGSHTVSHLNLSKMRDEKVIDDILENKKKLKEITGSEVQHFAYPFGTANEVGGKSSLIASRTGFKTITVAYGGSVRCLEFDLFNLKRLMLMEN